jgi:hypothetical protein
VRFSCVGPSTYHTYNFIILKINYNGTKTDYDIKSMKLFLLYTECLQKNLSYTECLQKNLNSFLMSTTKCSTNCRGEALVDLGCMLYSVNKLKKLKQKIYQIY